MSPINTKKKIVVIGKESTGKTQLVSSLTGLPGNPTNLRGSTLACESYDFGEWRFIDTPGLYFEQDTSTTREALQTLKENDQVLLVVQATHLDKDLDDLLGLFDQERHTTTIAATFWDKAQEKGHVESELQQVAEEIGVNIIPLDARTIDAGHKARLVDSLKQSKSQQFKSTIFQTRIGWEIFPPKTPIEWPAFGPFIGLFSLILPAMMAVMLANQFADFLDPVVGEQIAPLVASAAGLPSPLLELITGQYGLLTMAPLLFIWALPTVFLFALFLSLYKVTGLLDRLSTAMHPLSYHFGMAGRDLIRVVMGYGCNVPAVISTRSCATCTQKSCITAIAFGSACSYQLAATLSVFAAVDATWLLFPYLFYLTLVTLLYSRWNSSPATRARIAVPLLDGRVFLQWPGLRAFRLEVRATLMAFITKATPIFLIISVIASLLDWVGFISKTKNVLGPAMALFNLPEQVALPVVLASVRKDGILLFSSDGLAASLTHSQLLTGVFLASVFLPCLVTVYTIAREQGLRLALGILGRQSLVAILAALLLAWTGAAIESW